MSRPSPLRRLAVVVVVGAIVPMVALAQPKPAATVNPVVVSDSGVHVAPGTTLPGSGTADAGQWVSVSLAGQALPPCDAPGLPDAGKFSGFTNPLKGGCLELGDDTKYNRGAGHFPFCDSPWVKGYMGRCYKPCREGYDLVAGRCYKPCPSGFDPVAPSTNAADADRALVCRKPAPYGRGAGYAAWDEDKCKKDHKALGCEKWGAMWYPKCRAGFHNVGSNICSPDCPSGFTDTGVDCARDGYTPESKMAMECTPDEENVAGLCYPKCRAPYAYIPGDMPYWCKKGVVPPPPPSQPPKK